MTISNNTLSSLLSTGEIALEGQLSTSQAQTISSETVDGVSADSEFWSLLSQQFTDIVSQGDAQVIENKDLLALVSEFEASLEESGDGVAVNSEWLQVLKSHFDDSPLANSREPGAVEVSPLPLEATSPDQAQAIVASEPGSHGESLPLMWQDQATPLLVESADKTIERKLNAPVNNLTAIDPKELGMVARQNETVAKATTVLDALSADNAMDHSELDAMMKKPDANIADMFKDRSGGTQLNRDGFNAVYKIADSMSTPQNNVSALVQPPSAASPQSAQALPSALPTLTLQPHAEAAQWGNAIGERVSFLINHKLNHAEIRIDPPHLGKLDIQIQVKEDSAVVMIHTQNAQTRDLIDSASMRLRDYLQEAGYSSVDVNVSHREQSAQQEGFSQQNDSSVGSSENADSDEEFGAVQEVSGVVTLQDGVIDYFA